MGVDLTEKPAAILTEIRPKEKQINIVAFDS